MDFGKNKKIKTLEQKIIELSENISRFSERQNSQYTDIMLALKNIQDSTSQLEDAVDLRQYNALYEQAKEIVTEEQKASTSYLQRKLRIGYSLASDIINRLEENEVIGPANGSKAREVFTEDEEEEYEEEE